MWEELIIQLPESVAIAALSATVSNVEEFGAWMATVRGDTRIVLESTARPAVAAGHGQRQTLRPVQRPRPATSEPRTAAADCAGSAQQAGYPT